MVKGLVYTVYSVQSYSQKYRQKLSSPLNGRVFDVSLASKAPLVVAVKGNLYTVLGLKCTFIFSYAQRRTSVPSSNGKSLIVEERLHSFFFAF